MNGDHPGSTGWMHVSRIVDYMPISEIQNKRHNKLYMESKTKYQERLNG